MSTGNLLLERVTVGWDVSWEGVTSEQPVFRNICTPIPEQDNLTLSVHLFTACVATSTWYFCCEPLVFSRPNA